MTFAELYKLAREKLGDTVEPYHLDKTTALAYFNEAQHEACRRARLLTDSTTAAICTITLVAGTAKYVRDPRILRVRRVKWSGKETPLRRMSYKDLDAESPGWESHTGSLSGYILDLDKGYITFYRKPDALNVGTVQLSVVRLPLVDLAASTDVPEIPPHLHIKLVPWVVGKVRDDDDSELYDPKKALRMFDQFESEFGPAPNAMQESFDETQPYDEYTGDW